MSSGRRRPGGRQPAGRGGPSARGPAALLLLGTLSLGVGVLFDLHDRDDRAVVARDLGAVPASSDTGVPRPLSEKIPVLAAPSGPVVGVDGLPGGFDGVGPASSPGAVLPSASPQVAEGRPAGPSAVGGPPAGPRTAAEPAPQFADPGPARVQPQPTPQPLPLPQQPIGPQQPGLVSAMYPLPTPSRTAAAVPLVPAVLELPARSVTAPVDAVGTDPSGGMVVPEEVRSVGWWAPGVLPGGAAGSAVVAGHVDSRTQGVGVLSVLPRLTEGEPVLIRDAAGRTASYRVAARREYGKYDLPRDVFRRSGPPQLVLITCGGRFDPAARSYESNIVVYAVPA